MQNNAWKNKTYFIPCKFFREFPIPPRSNLANFEKAYSYISQKDTFISSFPKCGTTWTQHIVFLLHNEGVPSKDASEVINSIPYVEQDGFPEKGKIIALKYHLPFHLTPFSEDSRYIYVARNPKDTCVSYYHFLKDLPGYEISNFDDFFEAFLNGNIPHGDCMKHVNEWHEHRNLPNVLFLTYEEMMENHRDAVIRIAKFLNIETSSEKFISGVVRHSTFEFMKKHVDGDFMAKYLRQGVRPGGMEVADIGEHNENPIMLRRGIVGDWRNYFSKEQSLRMDKWMSQYPELMRLWTDIVE